MLSRASPGNGIMQSSEAVFLPFWCGYSQVLSCTVLLSFPKWTPELSLSSPLFMNSCPVVDFCRGGCWLGSSTSPSWWCLFMSFSGVQSSDSRFFDLLLTSLSSEVSSSQQPNQCRAQLVTPGLLLFYVNAIPLSFLSHVLSRECLSV